MNIDSTTIDRIVAGVLGELRSGSPSAVVASKGGFVLRESVITEEVLEKAKFEGGTISVSAKSVITPSGRDWLRKRNIQLQREKSESSPTRAEWNLIACESSDAIKQIQEDACSLGWSVEFASSDEEAAVWSVDRIANQITDGVMILTPRPERIAVRVNRNARARAAAIGTVQDYQRVREQMGANVLTLSARERSYFELRNLLKQIAAGGPPNEPTNW